MPLTCLFCDVTAQSPGPGIRVFRAVWRRKNLSRKIRIELLRWFSPFDVQGVVRHDGDNPTCVFLYHRNYTSQQATCARVAVNTVPYASRT